MRLLTDLGGLVLMAKKNVLGEIKALGDKRNGQVQNKTKTKPEANKQVENSNSNPLTNNRWEAWECFKDTSVLTNWKQVREGSLEDCFEELYDHIHCQIEEAWEEGIIDELEAKYGHEPDGVLEAMQRMSKPQLDAFKTKCLETGECEGQNWLIARFPSKFKRKEQPQAKKPEREQPEIQQPETQQSQTGIFTYSDEWEYWAIGGDDEDDYWDEDEVEDIDEDTKTEVRAKFDEEDLAAIEDEEFDNWVCLADGSLDDCLEAAWEVIRIEINMLKPSELGGGRSLEPEEYFVKLRQKEKEKIEEIRSACFKTGEYKDEGWFIRSVRTREQCEWIAKNGKP